MHSMDDERPGPKRRTADAGSFLVEVFYTPPNTHAAFHVHDQVTVVVPLSGYFVENTLKKSIQGKPGAVIVETPESPHENMYGPCGGTARDGPRAAGRHSWATLLQICAQTWISGVTSRRLLVTRMFHRFTSYARSEEPMASVWRVSCASYRWSARLAFYRIRRFRLALSLPASVSAIRVT
jgi:hypothetical protein